MSEQIEPRRAVSYMLHGGPADGREVTVPHVGLPLHQAIADEQYSREYAEWSEEWGLTYTAQRLALDHGEIREITAPRPPGFPVAVYVYDREADRYVFEELRR